jgi:hypothetical protein
VRAFLLILLLAAARPAGAAELSSVIFGREASGTLGSELILLSGERPGFLPGDRSFEQRGFWLHLRGGMVSTGSRTDNGTQLGPEAELRLGFVGDESGSFRDAAPVGFSLRVGAAMRPWAFNLPVRGAVVFHVSGELGAGGARWWSDTVRFSPMAGVRLHTAFGDLVRFELEYTLVPHVVTGTPRDMDVNRLEHRASARLGIGPVGLGVVAVISRERVRAQDRVREGWGGDRSWSGILEWRF